MPQGLRSTWLSLFTRYHQSTRCIGSCQSNRFTTESVAQAPADLPSSNNKFLAKSSSKLQHSTPTQNARFRLRACPHHPRPAIRRGHCKHPRQRDRHQALLCLPTRATPAHVPPVLASRNMAASIPEQHGGPICRRDTVPPACC